MPNTATHLDTLLNGSLADKYFLQMQWQMACTGRRWCDFVSFDPRLPEEMRMYRARVDRDVSVIVTLESAVSEFLSEIDAKVAHLRARYARKEAA